VLLPDAHPPRPSVLALALPASAQTAQRLYVMDCGNAHAPDQSRWSPGVNVGQPIDIVDNCYLIQHARGWMLWDTGVPDALASSTQPASGPIPWQRRITLAAQLQAIGVSPSAIRFVGISHTHGDHVGNVDQFPQATVLIQQAEYDWAFAQPTKPFSAEHPAQKLVGDHDVFGDGSVRIISTPGHTPGHQSLMVRLPNTGWVILSGDAAHFRDNFDHRRVPAMNVDAGATVALMERLASLVAENQAQLWINHDAQQAKTIRYAPQFYE
jgi:glyoxylase-like metal-dependent hydrolase (beta-lactamase superfamily II)